MSTLSIIIPCHNEEKRLPVEKLSSFLQQTHNIRIIFVDDGSTDNTGKLLENIEQCFSSQVRLIRLPKKSGKAEAVRTGFMESIKDDYYSHHGFIDADLAVTPDELYRLFNIITVSGKKFIFGSRIKKIGSTIQRNEWRHFYSRIIATIVGSIIRLDVYDTQCSAKIFQSELIQPIFAHKFRTRWLFDVELICRIHQQYGTLNKNGTEEPLLNWTEMKGSKLRWFHFFSIVIEVFKLKKYYQSKK